MPAKEYRDLRKFEVAEYDHARKRITVNVSFDKLEDALISWVQMLLANEVPPDRVDVVKANMLSALLQGTTIYDHECLATNRRVSLIIRK